MFITELVRFVSLTLTLGLFYLVLVMFFAM